MFSGLLQQMAAVCKLGGQLILLQHGKAQLLLLLTIFRHLLLVVTHVHTCCSKRRQCASPKGLTFLLPHAKGQLLLLLTICATCCFQPNVFSLAAANGGGVQAGRAAHVAAAWQRQLGVAEPAAGLGG